jgi:hypothetical protein
MNYIIIIIKLIPVFALPGYCLMALEESARTRIAIYTYSARIVSLSLSAQQEWKCERFYIFLINEHGTGRNI